MNKDREEALKFINQWKQELIMMSVVDNADEVINTIISALTQPEPEVVSVEDMIDNIGSIEYEYESPYQTINTSVGDRVAKIVVNYLASKYPNGIIIKGE